jgi:hypothetical protein
MVNGYLTQDDVLNRLENAQGVRTQVEFAADLKISQQMLSDVLRKRRNIPDEVLTLLGLEKVEQLYRRARNGKR